MHVCRGRFAELRANVHYLLKLPKALLCLILIKAYLIKSVECICCMEALTAGAMT